MAEKTLTQSDLNQFTGTGQYFRHSIVRSVLYTEGVRHMADHGGAHWLVDAIALAQATPAVRREEFQSWKLTVNADRSATLICDDGNGRVVKTERIQFTDFPLDSVALYFTGGVLLLPSEY